jgi:hypothetical protein
MNPAVAPFAILCGLVLAGVAVSLWTLLRVRAWIQASGQRGAAELQACQGALDDLRRTADGLAARIEEVRQQSTVSTQAAPPRGGLNLGKRSQALRMHRRGESADQIAAALEVPRQEVELLVKVHRIVMSSVM